jgi:hypothetical protein
MTTDTADRITAHIARLITDDTPPARYALTKEGAHFIIPIDATTPAEAAQALADAETVRSLQIESGALTELVAHWKLIEL